MIENIKPIDSLSIADLQSHSVWQYTNRDGSDETFVQPVTRVPVVNLTGKIVATQVLFPNGHRPWALIGNVDSRNARLNEHFLTLSVERNGRWFALARYHDIDYTENGPEGLARFFGLPVDKVFPIIYDLTEYAVGDRAALSGAILKEPRERLSRAEIIAMAVP